MLKGLDLRTGQLCRAFVGHEGPVYALAITLDGRHALSSSLDGDIKLWDLQQGLFLTAFPGSQR